MNSEELKGRGVGWGKVGASSVTARQIRTVGRGQGRKGRPRLALITGGLFFGFVGVTILVPLLIGSDPNALDLGVALQGPSGQHPLGTDQLGRDQLSRLLVGGRYTLALAAAGTAGLTALGLLVGVVSGYYGGRLDLVISGLTNTLLALPSLLLTLAILGIVGPGTGGMLLALIGGGWVGNARIFRAATLALREQPYIEAARATGADRRRILRHHLVPNVLPTVAVLSTLDFGALLLTVSSLSFLGLGVQPPTADWGVMLNEGRPFFGQVPLLALAPGICITLVVLASNLLGDALRDHVDRGRS